eukprot:COSAG04_NODE_2316_length_4342_cov_1.462173_3_plen_666_part_01
MTVPKKKKRFDGPIKLDDEQALLGGSADSGSPKLAALLLLALLALQTRSVDGGGGCTVPTAANYNASATEDDGSCTCQSRGHPDGFGCSPESIVLATESSDVFDADDERRPLCRDEAPLVCAHCNPATQTCKYKCESPDGAECTRLELEASLFRLGEIVSTEVNALASVVMVLLVAIAVLLQRCPRWLQESHAWMLVGMLLAMLLHVFSITTAHSAEALFARHIEFKGWVFFYLLLPIIILDAGFNMQRARFFRNIDRILLFSVLGTTVSSLVIAFVLYTVDLGVIEATHPFEALRFGALISATDPVASLSVLASMRPLTDRDLPAVIAGEAIINDATAIVLFDVFEHPGSSGHEPAELSLKDLWRMALRFITVGLGSLGLGAAIGLALALLTKRARDANLHIKPHEEIGLVSLSAYGSYVLANASGLSGIIALFFCAICLSHYAKPNLSEEAQRTSVTGFRSVAFLAEAVTFTYIGVDFVIGLDWASVRPGFVALTLFSCLLGRLLNIVPCSALLNSCRGSNALKPRSQMLLLVAGLRGPVAYGLAKTWRSESDDLHFAHIVSTTLIVVVLTTFFFGGAFAAIVRRLGMEAAGSASAESQPAQEDSQDWQAESCAGRALKRLDDFVMARVGPSAAARATKLEMKPLLSENEEEEEEVVAEERAG